VVFSFVPKTTLKMQRMLLLSLPTLPVSSLWGHQLAHAGQLSHKPEGAKAPWNSDFLAAFLR